MRVDSVVVQRYELYFNSEGNMRLYIYSEKVKLISNQLGSSYTFFGINSDGSAWFLICTSLISQQIVIGCSLVQAKGDICVLSQQSAGFREVHEKGQQKRG